MCGSRGEDPLENHKATKPTFNGSETAFRWWTDDGPLLVLYGSSVLSSPHQFKNSSRVGPPLTKHSGSDSNVMRSY